MQAHVERGELQKHVQDAAVERLRQVSNINVWKTALRRTQCDFGYPTCASCASVNIKCTGYNAVEGTETPRSTIAHLEKQIALLEVELNEIESSRPPSTSESVNIAVEVLSRRLAETIANPSQNQLKATGCGSDISLVSPEFLSQGPVPPFGEDFDNSSSLHARSQSTNIALVPKHVINILLKNYCSIYLLQYPAVEKLELYASCDRIFSHNSPSHYDIFTVAITLAISVMTSIRRYAKGTKLS